MGTVPSDHTVRHMRRILWRQETTNPVVVCDSVRVEMKSRWKLLAGDPGDGSRSRIEGVDSRMEAVDQFEVERDVFPNSKRIDQRLVRESLGTNGPGSARITQVEHAAIELFPNKDVTARKDPSRAL